MTESIGVRNPRAFLCAAAALPAWLTTTTGRRWLLCGLLAYAVIGSVVWIGRPGDFDGYLTVGRLVLTGRHIYADAPTGVNTWPPFFSVICVPLALLAEPSPYLARGFWLLLNFACLLLDLHLIARLVYRQPLSLHADGPGLSLAAPGLLVPLLLSDRFVSGNFDHLQINIVIFTLTLGGLYLHARGSARSAGMALGCAVAIKVMPIVFIPYLAYRRQWRSARYAALAWGAFSLSPILVFGWSRFWNYVFAWRASVTAGWGVGKMNQSIFAMWDRFIGHQMLPFTAGGINELSASGDPLVTGAVVLTLAVVTAGALWSFRGAAESDSWVTLAEWSVVFIVSALAGPVTWKAYLTVLLLPNTLLFAVWQTRRLAPRVRRLAGATLVMSFVLGALPSPGIVGKSLAGMLEMSSVVTISALIQLGGLLWLRTRLADPASSRCESGFGW